MTAFEYLYNEGADPGPHSHWDDGDPLPASRLDYIESKLAELATRGSLDPAGEIRYFDLDTAPTGYIEADGSVVLQADYADLYAAIGTRHNSGGETGLQFRLPDLRGEFLRGWSHGRSGVDVGRTIGSAQAENIGAHSHNYLKDTSAMLLYSAGNPALRQSNSVETTFNNPTGENRPRNVALLACIKT